MADMTRIKGRIQEVIRPNGVGAITAAEHQSLLLEMVDDINTKKADQSELIATQESLDALEQKVDNLPQGGGDFDAEGNYPLLHVGTADDLAGRGESVPAEFGFRASGGKSIKDGRAYIKRIKGNSVVWNQLVELNQLEGGEYSNGKFIITTTEEKTANLIAKKIGASKANHQYLLIGAIGTSLDTSIFAFSIGGSYPTFSSGNPKFVRSNSAGSIYVYPFGTQGTVPAGSTSTIDTLLVYDLTQMFGAGNEPTTIEDFNARVATLGIDLNAYNEGQVIHCNTESIKSVGDNLFNEDIMSSWEGITKTNDGWTGLSSSFYSHNLWENNLGYDGQIYVNAKLSAERTSMNVRVEILYEDGSHTSVAKLNNSTTLEEGLLSNSGKKVDRIAVNYSDVGQMTIHHLMISLAHSGWKAEVDNTYKPYWQDILPLPIIRKYFPNGMESAGSAHDEIRYNKVTQKWEYSKGRMKEVDMGTLNWKNLDASNGMFWLSRQEVIDLNMATHDNENIPTNLISSLYASAPTYDIVNIDKVFRGPFTTKYSGYLTVKDTAYTDAATFKAAMAGVILYYEAEDWEWVELDAEDQNFRDYYNVADFGTEMSQSSVPSAPFSADIIYQFNAVDMIREHELEITELQSIITEQQSVIATMQAQLTSLINGGQ